MSLMMMSQATIPPIVLQLGGEKINSEVKVNSKHQDWGRTFNWMIAFFVLGAQKEKTHVKEMVAVLLFVLQNQTLDNTNKLESLLGDLDVGNKLQEYTLMLPNPCVS